MSEFRLRLACGAVELAVAAGLHGTAAEAARYRRKALNELRRLSGPSRPPRVLRDATALLGALQLAGRHGDARWAYAGPVLDAHRAVGVAKYGYEDQNV